MQDYMDSILYGSLGIFSCCIGFDIIPFGDFGLNLSVALARIGYENSLFSVYVDFASAKCVFGMVDGWLTIDIGFGFFDFGFSINLFDLILFLRELFSED